MRKKWWLWVILGMGVLMIIGGGFIALMDRPAFSQDEVKAIVQNHFASNKYASPPYTSSPKYIGNGKWSGWTTIGSRQVDWYFYEKTRTTEVLSGTKSYSPLPTLNSPPRPTMPSPLRGFTR